jgi:hypothetical protein
MANYASNNMVLIKINMLVIVHLEECPCGGVLRMRFPSNNLFFQAMNNSKMYSSFPPTSINIYSPHSIGTCYKISTRLLFAHLTNDMKRQNLVTLNATCILLEGLVKFITIILGIGMCG